jgi:hypothetical protein
VDVVGNAGDPRTGTPRLGVWIDNVAPVITVTEALAKIDLGNTATVLSGTVSDGGPTHRVFIHVHTPDGQVHQRQAARDGARWWLDLQPLRVGRYTLWAHASDLAGNVTTVGPFKVNNTQPVYIPMVVKNKFAGVSTVYLPLVVRDS